MTLQRKAIKLGIEKVLTDQVSAVKNLKVGLICNQASVNHQFRHSADMFFEHQDINLKALFGPQHGIRGDVQDNMVETGHSIDKLTGLPIYSLYSETRDPTEEMLSGIDALVFDLQDVGCRVYTFIYTMANAMRACAKFGKKMLVLDRPNPIGGLEVEGNILQKGHESFVGMYPIPMRHGLTVGELAKYFNSEFDINCELEVITMDNWERKDFYDETDAPWVMPSPNMPTVDTAVVFPGTVYFEGTQISEGRGTTRPFEIIGAPFINSNLYADALNSLELPGVIFRAWEFLPTFQKHAQKLCGGAFLHITDRESFEPVITGAAMVKAAFDLYPSDFKWKNPPYEYVFDRNPFDVIAGTTELRESFEQGITINELRDQWRDEISDFELTRARHLLY
ncbi:MAG: exo-beta-N-acetylmuramidase NamZ family protein [Pyrinomonadaceae bacterium]